MLPNHEFPRIRSHHQTNIEIHQFHDITGTNLEIHRGSRMPRKAHDNLTLSSVPLYQNFDPEYIKNITTGESIVYHPTLRYTSS